MGKTALLGRSASDDALWDEDAWLVSGWNQFESGIEVVDPSGDAPDYNPDEGEALTLEHLQGKGARFLTRSTWFLTLIFTLMAVFASSKIWW
ncbi:MAG: hypothetical protein AAFY81_09625, partial [Pseudomonadota bacterium]